MHLPAPRAATTMDDIFRRLFPNANVNASHRTQEQFDALPEELRNEFSEIDCDVSGLGLFARLDLANHVA